MRKLDALSPPPSVKGGTFEHGLEQLFQFFTIDGGPFLTSAMLLPWVDNPFLNNPEFIKDRSEMLNAELDPEQIVQGQAHGLSQMRQILDLMETKFLADGREWILGGKEPTLADIQAVWPMQWIVLDPLHSGKIQDELSSSKAFPKTLAWIRRFQKAIDEKTAELSKPIRYDNAEAASKILSAEFHEAEGKVDENDPLQLQKGQLVGITPTDSGTNHTQVGKLDLLTIDEVAVINEKGIRVHFPRWNFAIAPVEAPDPSAKLSAPPSMRMIYHPVSPFSRKAYMYALELGIADRITLDKVVVAPIHYPGWSDNNDDVAPWNPMAKIPTLVPQEHGDGIFDSRVVCEYLESEAPEHSRPKPSSDKVHHWRLKAVHACADGILDAIVLIVYEEKIRADLNLRFDAWVKGQTQKIERGFERLELEAERDVLSKSNCEDTSSVMSPSEVAVAAALGYFDLAWGEQFKWRENRPNLTEWYDAFQKRDSWLKTRSHLAWKTGKHV